MGSSIVIFQVLALLSLVSEEEFRVHLWKRYLIGFFLAAIGSCA